MGDGGSFGVNCDQHVSMAVGSGLLCLASLCSGNYIPGTFLLEHQMPAAVKMTLLDSARFPFPLVI